MRILSRESFEKRQTVTGKSRLATSSSRTRIVQCPFPSTLIRKAEQRITGCERCRGDEAEIPFDLILADVLGKRGPYEFVMSETARCPNCRAELTEKTFVEPQIAIEGGVRNRRTHLERGM